MAFSRLRRSLVSTRVVGRPRYRAASCAALAGLTLAVTAAGSLPANAAQRGGVTQQPDGYALGKSLPSSAPVARGDFFPAAVWFESVTSPTDVASDKAVGLNTYLQLTESSDTALIRAGGMRSIASPSPGSGSFQHDGILLPDEVDMWAGAGSGAWTGAMFWQGESCVDPGSGCGYTVLDEFMKTAPVSPVRYGQFGKGVTFWQSDAEASRFVNDHPNIVSADNYWMTDPNICSRWEGGRFLGEDRSLTESECRAPSNYGATVRKMRSLVKPSGSKPVWVFVEVGTPFGGDGARSIEPWAVEAAVWSGLVNGARGVAYFNHNFGGPCQSQHVLRDGCGGAVRPTVTRTNRKIASMARVLNAPDARGVLRVSGDVDSMVKSYRGKAYLFVAPRKHASSTRLTLTTSCAKSGVVRHHGSRVAMRSRAGIVRDNLAPRTSVRVYEVTLKGRCR